MTDARLERLAAETDELYWGDALSSLDIRTALARAFEMGREAARAGRGESAGGGCGPRPREPTSRMPSEGEGKASRPNGDGQILPHVPRRLAEEERRRFVEALRRLAVVA